MLKGLGMKGEKGFDDAEGDMKEAQGDLKGEKGQKSRARRPVGGKGAAVDAQGRALQALREGAQGMQQQMAGSAGQRRAATRRAGCARATARATIRWAGSAKATWAATTARSGNGRRGRAGAQGDGGTAPPPRRPEPPGRRARLSRTADEPRLKSADGQRAEFRSHPTRRRQHSSAGDLPGGHPEWLLARQNKTRTEPNWTKERSRSSG